MPYMSRNMPRYYICPKAFSVECPYIATFLLFMENLSCNDKLGSRLRDSIADVVFDQTHESKMSVSTSPGRHAVV